jgi:phosphatidylserine/phosphatidylglycerophosphate/cardiolipin synthase-like enzyme
MAMLVSDTGILRAMSKFKPASEDIEGVVDPHEMKQVMYPSRGTSKIPPALFWFVRNDRRFVAAPSHAFSENDNNDFMHNKVMILDDSTMITGSYNFSESAESNDENMLILESSDVANAYSTYFEALFKQYQKDGAPLPPKLSRNFCYVSNFFLETTIAIFDKLYRHLHLFSATHDRCS